MNARKRKKPDFRRIRPSQTYSVMELSEEVQRTTATVRRWLREGLPTIDGLKPTLIDGAQAKQWLRRKWESRKQHCGSGEAYCSRCKIPRPFTRGSRYIEPNGAKVVTIKGLCGVCGCRMNKFASAKSVAILDIGNERKRDRNAA